jgi:hypothetical protein
MHLNKSRNVKRLLSTRWHGILETPVSVLFRGFTAPTPVKHRLCVHILLADYTQKASARQMAARGA